MLLDRSSTLLFLDLAGLPGIGLLAGPMAASRSVRLVTLPRSVAVDWTVAGHPVSDSFGLAASLVRHLVTLPRSAAAAHVPPLKLSATTRQFLPLMLTIRNMQRPPPGRMVESTSAT
jgi:hypothetical protein